MRSVSRTFVAVAAALALAGGCSSDSGTAAPTTTVVPASTTVLGGVVPRVDLIASAISALEAKFGGPQRYYEINATSKLVNLWVSLNDGAVAQPWVYLDGTLSSKEGQRGATGYTFPASAVAFDASKVLAGVRSQLPDSSIDGFVIQGGAAPAVQYTVLIGSPTGNQLTAVVGPDGSVKSVGS